jgi:ribosomal protein L31E
MVIVDPVWSQTSSPLPESTTATSSTVSPASPTIAATGPDTQQALQSLMAMDAGDGLNQQLRKLALQHLPESYVDDRKWDRTETIKTLIPRSEPLVMKHGTWTKYELTPVDPERTLAIRLTNVRHNEDDRLAFNLACDLTVDVEARQARWQRGVQLYSLKADITARVTVELDCRLGLRLDLKSEPAVVLAPHVQATQVTLHEFRIHRISKVGGEFAQQATKAARKWLEEHASEHEAKLTESINKQLQKKPEKLRIALSR